MRRARKVKFREAVLSASIPSRCGEASSAAEDAVCEGVVCEEFTAFAKALLRLLRHHGVAFASDDTNFANNATLVPFDEATAETFLEDLTWNYQASIPHKTPNKGEGVVPWLSAAKRELEGRSAAAVRKRMKEREKAAEMAAEAAAKERAQALLEQGVTLSGKQYKLIPAD